MGLPGVWRVRGEDGAVNHAHPLAPSYLVGGAPLCSRCLMRKRQHRPLPSLPGDLEGEHKNQQALGA